LIVDAYDRWARLEMPDWPFGPDTPTTASELKHELDRRGSAAHPGGPMVVVLDELERIYPRPGEREELGRWITATGALRALAQNVGRSVVLIGADLRPRVNRTNELGDDQTNPFFQLFREVPLPLLDATATVEMVTSIAGESGVQTVTEQFHRELFLLTGGHPSLTRTIAGAAFRRRQDFSVMDEHDLARGLADDEGRDNVAGFVRSFWDMLRPIERAVLRNVVAGVSVPASFGAAERGEATASLAAHGILAGDALRVGILERRILEGGPDDDT
jgi:hypothetical protein